MAAHGLKIKITDPDLLRALNKNSKTEENNTTKERKTQESILKNREAHYSKTPKQKRRKKDNIYDYAFPCRGFEHSNSKKKEISKYREFRDEALECGAMSYSTLRNGRGRSGAGQDTPDVWDDYFIYRKWPVKPKCNDHKGRRTIRKAHWEETDDRLHLTSDEKELLNETYKTH